MSRSRRRTPSRQVFRPRRWALLLLVAAGLAIAYDLLLPAGSFPPSERRAVLVERGQSLSHVAAELKRVGLLHGTVGFQVLARLMGLDRSIKAGQYSFKLGITVPALLRAFARGMYGLNLVTIPEGLTLGEVNHLLAGRLGVRLARFDSLAHDRAFLDSLRIDAPSIEGYLAPDSYEFLPGTAPEVAFRTMVNRTNDVLLKAAAGRDSLPLGLSLYQILTLASIVESEAQIEQERRHIARVYLNRLQIGMPTPRWPTGSACGRARGCSSRTCAPSRRSTPTSTRACRRGRSAIPARPASTRCSTRCPRPTGISTSWRAAAGAACSRAPTPSTCTTSARRGARRRR